MAVATLALSLSATSWPGLIALLIIGLAIAWTAGVLHARYALTHPPRRTYATALVRSQPGTPEELDAARFGVGPRRFTEWFLDRPGRGAPLPVWEISGDDPAGPTVIFTHGWGDGRIGALLRLEPFVPHAARLLLWDLPGHGDAPRAAGPCRLGSVEHADLAALIERTDGPLVLFGWSLGGGLSIVAGRHPRIIGVAAEAPYTLPQVPASRVMTAKGLPGAGMLRAALASVGGLAWLRPGGPFDRAAHAAKLTVPLLVLHGERDPVCPVEGGRRIAAAASRATLVIIPDARHNDLWINPAHRSACRSALTPWLASLRQGPRAEKPALPDGPTHLRPAQTR